MVSGNQALSAALLGGAVMAPAHARHSPPCPTQGPGGRARTRTRTQDGRAPHRQPPVGLEGGEPDATPLARGAPAPGRGGRRL
jgi:hypothetical protein